MVADGRWSAFSPLLYRQLLNAFYAGVKRVAPGRRGDHAPGSRRTATPPASGGWRRVQLPASLLCLAGPAASAGARCPEPPHFDVLAFHPLSVGDPDRARRRPRSTSSIADAAKVTRLLAPRRARRHGAARAAQAGVGHRAQLGKLAPSRPAACRRRCRRAWISRALHRLWVAGVALVAWQFLVDPYPAVRAGTPTGGLLEYQRPAGPLQRGTRRGPRTGRRPKPFLAGFTFPFDPLPCRRRGGPRMGAASTRTADRPAAAGERRSRRWRTLGRVQTGATGVLNALVRMGRGGLLRLVSGALVSPAAYIPAAGGRRRPSRRAEAPPHGLAPDWGSSSESVTAADRVGGRAADEQALDGWDVGVEAPVADLHVGLSARRRLVGSALTHAARRRPRRRAAAPRPRRGCRPRASPSRRPRAPPTGSRRRSGRRSRGGAAARGRDGRSPGTRPRPPRAGRRRSIPRRWRPAGTRSGRGSPRTGARASASGVSAAIAASSSSRPAIAGWSCQGSANSPAASM